MILLLPPIFHMVDSVKNDLYYSFGIASRMFEWIYRQQFSRTPRLSDVASQIMRTETKGAAARQNSMNFPKRLEATRVTYVVNPIEAKEY